MNLENRAAIYIRVSTQFQIDKDSLQVQRRELEAYSELVLGIREFDVFEDPGYSGKDTSRPAYQRMMAKIRAGGYSHLLVWKIDRISRNLLDFATMYEELQRLGVTFVSKNEQFDTSTAIGEAMLKIILVFAELERKMTAERVTAVMLSRANNGQWNGGRIPYGYDWDRDSKSFSVNEKEAEVYRFICEQYERKHSLLRVCDELNSRGIVTKTGGAWNPVGVHKMLTNVFYKGVYRYNVHSDGKGNRKRESAEWIEVEGHHPALISDERFSRIGYILKHNKRKGEKKGDTLTGKAVHIFAGLLECGYCGANMTASRDRIRSSGHRPSIYGCSTRRKNASACRNKYINDIPIASDVFGVMAEVLRAVESGKRVTEKELEKRILKRLPSVLRVEGLGGFSRAIGSGTTGMEYRPPMTEGAGADVQAMRDRKRRLENSIRRLQSLYLYGSDAITEKDYRIERKRMLDELEEVDGFLQDAGDEEAKLSEQEFRDRASYFIMVDRLLGPGLSDTETVLRTIDPSVPKAFMNMVIDRIKVADGHVEEIRFKSGLAVRIIRE